MASLSWGARRAQDALVVVDFADVEAGLAAGLYSSRRLNPPTGDDCAALLVRDDGSLGWAYADGTQSEDSHGVVSSFSAADLCQES